MLEVPLYLISNYTIEPKQYTQNTNSFVHGTGIKADKKTNELE
jgi:hypothetical protein